MIWLFATLACMFVQAFFSMQEMAIISINRLEVLFFSDNGNKNAKKIAYFLQNPHVLFTTTLIMVNIALQIGSECSRRFYSQMHLSSNLAPLSQILAVVIVAELAPLFAARTWPRPISMAGAGVLYFCAKCLFPIASVLGAILRLCHRNKDKPLQDHLVLKRDEMWHMIAQDEGCRTPSLAQRVSDKLLSMRTLQAGTLAMTKHLPKLKGGDSVWDAMLVFKRQPFKEILLYERDPQTITGVLTARMLIGVENTQKLREIAKAPFFVGCDQKICDWLIPFKESSSGVAVVLDKRGKARGSITFDDIAHFLFAESTKKSIKKFAALPVIDRVFAGKTPISQIYTEYGLNLDHYSAEVPASDLIGEKGPLSSKQTLGKWVWNMTQRPLRTGDQFSVGNIELELVEMGVVFPKLIRVVTKQS